MGCRVGSGEGVTWWRERSRTDEQTGSADERWRAHRESDRCESEERERRGVMKERGRLIHIRRRNSLKTCRDAKRLVQLTECPTYGPSILPPSRSLCTPYISISPAAMTFPHPIHPPHPLVVMSTLPPVAMSTTPPTTCSNIRACILS